MLALVVLSVLVPALGYAALLYAFDVHEREPVWALAMLFVAGALCVPLTGALESAIDARFPFFAAMLAGDRAAALFGSFGVIAPIEELVKLCVVALLARRKLMDEPVDGVVYAGTAALGFAAAEGALAALSGNAATLIARALLAMPGHLCFSALWGAGLGALRYWGLRVLPGAILALLAALLAHGTYDYLLVASGGAQRGAVVAVLAGSGVVSAVAFRALLRASPYRGVAPRAGRCRRCRVRHAARARFCAGCGAALVELVAPALPLGFAATLLAFTAEATSLVSGSVLAASMLGSDGTALWTRALDAPSRHTLAAALVVGAAAALSGLCARAFGNRYALLEAWTATALVALAALLYLALSEPASTLRALALMPVAFAVSGWVAHVRKPS